MTQSRAATRRQGPAPAGVAVDAGVMVLATTVAFGTVLGNGFVNWDDPDVLVNNLQLGGPHVVSWAFKTTLIGHYQPLAWLTWAAARSLVGPSATVFHGLSLAGHLLNGLLVWAVARRLAQDARVAPFRRRTAALVAALAFLLHPLRVEPVAWASAFPYVLSLTALLIAFLAYLRYGSGQKTPSAGWLGLSLACYAASLFARAIALGFPLVLLLVDFYPLERQRRGTGVRRLLAEKIPFALVTAAAAVAEAHAREIATLQEVGIGARLTLAATAPFVYLQRTLVPIRLSPLDALPISPGPDSVRLAAAAAGLVLVTAIAWRLRHRLPIVFIAWIAYLTMLAPVVGLTASGLQATADRYVYVPGVILSIVIGVGVARSLSPERRRPGMSLAAAGVVVALGVVTAGQVRYWHDSIALWTRTADLDPRNDVAAYNLAIALAEAGREDEAIRWYERTLALVPDHDLARQNVAILRAARAEHDADRLAAAGRLDEASDEYARALALDARRLHARAARGMALTERGRFAEAVAELRVAFDRGSEETEVANALAFALTQTGQSADAVAVLKRAVAAHADNVNLTHNLARLLATAPDTRVRDGPLALRLALDVRDRTGGRDPRALDTLAAAYAAVGRLDRARETATEAAARARELGDEEQAREIAAHARRYGR